MKRLLTVIAAVAGMSLLAGCDDDDSNNTPFSAGTPTASVRVVHASPDAPAVDVYADGQRVVSGAPYQTASGFLRVEAGARTFAVTPAGATEPKVIEATLPLAEGSFTTIVAVGPLERIEPLVISESASGPAAGFVKVRVGHAAPAVPEVDVYVTAPSAELETSMPTLAEVPFKAVSDVLEVPAGDYRIRITAAGDKTPVFDSGSVALAAGADLVVLAVAEDEGHSPVSLLTLTRGSPASFLIRDNTARVRVLHASPDAPAVDVLVDNTEVLGDVAYPTASGYLSVPSGARNLKVNAANTASTVIDATPTLDAGASYSVLAVNFLASIEPLVLVDDRTSVADKARVRVVHASPDANNVDVLANDTVVLTNVPFKAASDYLEVDPGDYVFKLNAAGTSTTAFTSPTLSLEGGKVYTAVAIGSLASEAANPLTIKVLVDN